MYKDVQNSNNVDKQMLNQLVNENVIPKDSKQNSKNPSFYWGFFLSVRKIVVMKSDEGFSNNVDKQMLIQLVNENVKPFLFRTL